MNRSIWAMIFGAVLFAGAVHADGQAGKNGFELNFVEQESGTEPYPVRILVTADFMRMDEGSSEDDFLLMQRADGRILSVTHDTRSVLEIPRQAVDISPPDDFEVDDHWRPEPKAPQIAGKTMLHYSQKAAERTCVDVVVAEGLLPEVTAAFKEFHLTLSGQQAQTLDNTPREFRNNCYLARLVFARAPFLDRGLPIIEWDDQGYRRQLIGFKPLHDLDASLFTVPTQYERYGVGGAPPL